MTASIAFSDLVEIKPLITAFLGAVGGYVWSLGRSVEKLKRHAATTQTQLPAVLTAIEKLREDLTQWRIAAAVSHEQLLRVRKDVDAAHGMIRDLRLDIIDDETSGAA